MRGSPPHDDASQGSGFIIVRVADQGSERTRGEPSAVPDPIAQALQRYSLGSRHVEPVVKSLSPRRVRETEAKGASPVRGESTPPSLTTFRRIDARALTAKQRQELTRQLADLDGVGSAYVELPADDPASSPALSDVGSVVTHRSPAPHGVNSEWARDTSGAPGQAVRLVDVEQGWQLDHPDLPRTTPPAPLAGHNRRSRVAHGTQVLGVVACQRPGLGIAPSVEIMVSSHYDETTDTSGRVADAIYAALAHLEAGDVLLLEVQRGTPARPTEIDEADLNAIRRAVHQGVTVIEAAGNGNLELTSAEWGDSGAILVGACQARRSHDQHQPRRVADLAPPADLNLPAGVELPPAGSNYGSRVDCYAWGEGILTTHVDGNLEGGLYTNAFNLTSGAAAIVAGVAAVIQGLHRARTGAPLTPEGLRSALRDPSNGTPCEPTGGAIGTMPDLERVARSLRLV